jgi:hypothetical protein
MAETANINDLIFYQGKKLDNNSWQSNFVKVVDWLNDIYSKLNTIYENYNQTIITDLETPEITKTLQNNYKYHYGNLTNLTLTYPEGNFTASVDFSSGGTPTTLVLPENTIYPYGDKATPEVDTVYRLIFEWDGTKVKCTCVPFGAAQ